MTAADWLETFGLLLVMASPFTIGLIIQVPDDRRSLVRATKRKQQMQDERQKLLRAHYAGAVPQDLLASEMKRLTRELAEADTEITTAKTTNTNIEAKLDAALKAAGNCETAYLGTPDHIRRQINQGFFEKLYIGEDGSIERAEFTEPFRALLDAGHALTHTQPTSPNVHGRTRSATLSWNVVRIRTTWWTYVESSQTLARLQNPWSGDYFVGSGRAPRQLRSPR